MRNTITICIIGVLLAIILIQKACTSNVEKPKLDVKVVTKTVYIPIYDTIYIAPKVIKTVAPNKPLPLQYLPDTNYTALKKQYQRLIIEHLSQNIYEDKLNLDTLGTIVIRDTTQFNRLRKRSYEINLRIPKRTDSVFITRPVTINKRQIYLGMGANSTQTLNTFGIRYSLLYKDKKDNIFNPSVTINTNGNIIYGIDTYFKIKLK